MPELVDKMFFENLIVKNKVSIKNSRTSIINKTWEETVINFQININQIIVKITVIITIDWIEFMTHNNIKMLNISIMKIWLKHL